MDPEKQDEKPAKKSIPIRKRFRKFRRHLMKVLRSEDTILAMQFLFQLLFIYAGIAMLGLLVYYFMFQNYNYFLILVTLCGLMYISHLGVNIAHLDTIKSLQFYEVAQSGDGFKSKALLIVKLISVMLSQFIFLDIPIFYFQISSQKNDIEAKLKKIIDTEDKRKKQALKNKDKGKPEFEQQQQQQVQEFMTTFNDLKKQKKDRIQFLPNKFGCLSIFGFVPVTFLINVWLCSKPNQIIVFPENQGVILIVALAFNITSAIIGLYEIQFFDKSAASFIDSIKWFTLRYLELLCKSLLIGYYIKFSEFQEVSLLIIGISYLTFSVFCTFLFTLFDYEKKVTVEQDQEQQPLKSEEQVEKPIEKGCFYVFKCYVKSLILNIYARTLYLPYKECALGMKTLSFFQVGYNASKKMVREEVACDGWKNLMITYDISSKQGIQRRTYTHIIQGLRFFELFHLALFCVCSNIIHGQFKEMVEPKQVQLYYSGKLISIVSIVILMLYYVRGGYRTIHEKQLDISSIDE